MKKLYITTAIPYANAKPHVGNAIDYLLADIWRRYQIQSGETVRFQVGTDEHGDKIAQKAKQNNQSPQEYVDQTHLNFKKLITKMDVEYTDFIRTTDIKHKAAAQYIWQQLKPYIYKKSYTGWYCQGCESFVSEQEYKDNHKICPDHKTEYQKVEEENYFLKTSQFSDQIRQAIESEKMKITPTKRQNEFLNLIKDGLEDVSISRPKKSVDWGIPVPEDPEQVMYVWVDALVNYITVLGYPNKLDWAEYWPANVQVIGKDILRFHAGIWPSVLLGLGLELPKVLLVHGHVTNDGQKMSKTIGNVVDPFEVIDKYGVDAFRYYFARYIPTQDDGDFTWKRFEDVYNNELGNDFGNLISRVASMINKYQAGSYDSKTLASSDDSAYYKAMDEFKFNIALDEVWANIRSLNKYIDTVKPWEVAKEQTEESKQHLAEIMNYLAGGIKQVSQLLIPFMPQAITKIDEIFADGQINLPQQPLFPKIYDKEN